MPSWSIWRRDLTARWLSRDAVALARVQQWLSVAAGQLAYGPSSAPLAVLFGAKLDIERAQAISRQLFDVLDGHLAGRRYLVGNTPTIADVAIYAYTAHAAEGGVFLDPYGHVRAWLRRIELLPGFVAMRRSTPPESVWPPSLSFRTAGTRPQMPFSSRQTMVAIGSVGRGAVASTIEGRFGIRRQI
jgi:hypothetical protein